MFLSRFGVKRYKCLAEIDIPLTPIHVLIGENDAGKTSLLEAMAAFHTSSEKPLQQVFPEPWSGRELVLHGQSSPSIELWGEWAASAEEEGLGLLPKFRYGFEVGFPSEGRNCLTEEESIEANGQEEISLWPASRGSPETALRVCRTGREIPRKIPTANLKAVSKLLKPAHKYALDPKLMAVPAMIDVQRKFRMDPDGFGLATLLGDIVDYDAQLSIHLRTEFCCLFPQFKGVHTESASALRRQYTTNGLYNTSTGDGKGIYFVTQTGDRIPAQQASDGAVLFLGILALAHLPDPPNLLLIEEPENGIYPKRLGEVITLLKQMVGRTDGTRFPQIILSTHSPYVLSFFEPEEATFLSRSPEKPDAGVRARPLRDAPHIKERLADGDFYLGELWYNYSEEDLFGEH